MLCREAELSSSATAADILECLDVVSELSAGFDTSTSVSSGSHASTVSRTGMIISSLIVVVYSIQNCDETGDFEWTKSDILDNMFHVSLLLTFCTSALGTQEICCPK